MSAREHCCAFCGSVMRLLLLPAADGSGKILCCWGCEAAGRMDAGALLGAVDTAVDGCYACEDCGQPLAAAGVAAVCRACQAVRHGASWRVVTTAHYATMPLATVDDWPAATRRAVKRYKELDRG